MTRGLDGWGEFENLDDLRNLDETRTHSGIRYAHDPRCNGSCARCAARNATNTMRAGIEIHAGSNQCHYGESYDNRTQRKRARRIHAGTNHCHCNESYNNRTQRKKARCRENIFRVIFVSHDKVFGCLIPRWVLGSNNAQCATLRKTARTDCAFCIRLPKAYYTKQMESMSRRTT